MATLLPPRAGGQTPPPRSWVPCVSCLLPWVSLRSTVLTCWLGWPPFGLFASMFTTTIMY